MFSVAPAIGVPQTLELVVLEYHWYEAVPVPPVMETDNCEVAVF